MTVAPPFTRTVAEALGDHSVQEAEGLTSAEARTRLAEHGPNELPAEPGTPLWALILEQFKDQLVLILLGAA
ncbi:cation-transporting P-type ATPase, partial [Chytriomyces sp. MP71]